VHDGLLQLVLLQLSSLIPPPDHCEVGRRGLSCRYRMLK
jgi:hypothetical protein